MNAEPKARLLDVTRLVSRIGRGPLTGVDRVERAYLRALLARHTPLFLLLRTPFGHLILPRTAGPLVLGWIASPQTVPRPDFPFGLGRDLPILKRARIALRDHRLRSCLPWRLTRAVHATMPQGGVYLNVGHANLSERTLAQLQDVPGLRVAVMIHDTIPLDHPDLCRESSVAAFRDSLAATAHQADLILCPSQAAAKDIRRWCDSFRRVPEVKAVHLGVDPVEPDLGNLPATLDLGRPYFVTLGTIEPRKNHALLLDVWVEMANRIPAGRLPQLIIIGQRGWRNQAVFDRLDALRAPDSPVHEFGSLGDAAVAALVMGAKALLMPSLAEGYGLPVIEAARLGTPVLCNDLPVFREILGDYAVYADVADMYSWTTRIIEFSGRVRAAGPGRVLETDVGWTEYFKTVLSTV
ncbi:glycosyltransferase family 4 protein [Albidovulum sediminis]|uniref:Glycosyltransferase family 4 protein n=1 Tax=Albidovulum sediminis TaxID=3066345 RepID=A0ABT2NQZ9_9RHOB|nr:glycosyltransferase family 1 protein [Defluviimonas sediminis]MCT8331357.1 glycosyltransferase family 4 protein [Defluviimonas sediminis]